ncbi:MAG: hypothetical protein KDE58_02170, partial [Caldilineaceae bacterium]|nr:hypothetical protein [Caldilineaceae bacterium]
MTQCFILDDPPLFSPFDYVQLSYYHHLLPVQRVMWVAYFHNVRFLFRFLGFSLGFSLSDTPTQQGMIPNAKSAP